MKKTILITGASSGYGLATAQHFLDQGWNVIAPVRPAFDVTDPASIERAFSDCGPLDAVVNNAGIGLLSAFEVTPDAIAREIFETNTFGVMAVCRAAIPRLRERGGTLVNVTSSTALAPMPLVSIYTASKCAVEGFSESLAYELRLVGVRVRLVEPGLAPTTRFAANGATRMQGLTPPPYDDFAQKYMDRMANYPTPYCTEAEVAQAVWAAVTDDGGRLRYPAGADSKMLAELRWGSSEEHYHARMREMFAPGL